MTSVGAFQGKGGYQEQYQNDHSSEFHVGSEQDSYLGETLLKHRLKYIKFAIHLLRSSTIQI